MKLSCNGCRILRKGCSDDCIIRPCLEWINSPESQANATLFLAKFYGRTGLLNLITAAPQHLAPAVFRSLLYEACGRIVNPTYGSMGLFWTGEWARCEAAVDAVLTGSKINGVAVSDWRNTAGTLGDDNALPVYDIRHVPRVTGLTEIRERSRLVRTGNVIKPEARVGSGGVWKMGLGLGLGWGRESAETAAEAASLLERNRTGETAVDLELSLGFHCQSATTTKPRFFC